MVVCFILKWKKFPWWFFGETQNSNDFNWKIKWLFWLFRFASKEGKEKNENQTQNSLSLTRILRVFLLFRLSHHAKEEEHTYFFRLSFFFLRVKKLKKPTSQSDVKLKPHIYTYSRQFQSIFFGKTNMLINDDLRESDNKCSCVCRQSALKIKYICSQFLFSAIFVVLYTS